MFETMEQLTAGAVSKYKPRKRSLTQILADHPESWENVARIVHKRVIRDKRWSAQRELEFLVVALSGEVGELCNLVKKRMRGDEIGSGLMIQEMADIQIYLRLLFYHFDATPAVWCAMKQGQFLRRKSVRKLFKKGRK